jgi:hypothetical protein
VLLSGYCLRADLLPAPPKSPQGFPRQPAILAVLLSRRKAMPDAKDLALAVLGGSLGLAALLLVPIGALLAHAASFPSGTDKAVTGGFRRAARLGLIPTAGAVVEALLCYAWLVWRADWLLAVWVIGFPVLMIGFLAYVLLAFLKV